MPKIMTELSLLPLMIIRRRELGRYMAKKIAFNSYNIIFVLFLTVVEVVVVVGVCVNK